MLMLVQLLPLARGLVVLPSPRSLPRFFYFQLLVVLWMVLVQLPLLARGLVVLPIPRSVPRFF